MKTMAEVTNEVQELISQIPELQHTQVSTNTSDDLMNLLEITVVDPTSQEGELMGI